MSLFKKKNEIQKVELSEKNVRLRVVLIAVLLAVGLGCLAFFLVRTLTEEPGWQTVEITNQNYMEAGEIILNYDLGRGELSATKEKRELQTVYGNEMMRVYRLFDALRTYDDVKNVSYVNRHPNEILTVDTTLYNAFALLAAYGDRTLYLAPIQAQYRSLFLCDTDASAGEFDPYVTEEIRTYAAEIAAFAADPSAVRVELLGQNQIRLVVSQDYLDYAAENELDSFIDFSWLANAFVIDAVADTLVSKGFTRGYLTSCDGYARYLDGGEAGYTVPLYDKVGREIYPAAVATVTKAKALVQLRDYPFPNERAKYYYGYADGRCATCYASVEDGLYKSAFSDLNAFSESKGCAEMVLTLSSAFIADEPDETKLTAADAVGISVIWCVDREVRYTAHAPIPTQLFDNGTVRYTVSPVS